MIYGVYIIESLRSNDYFDGDNLSQILTLSKINNKYAWVDTIDDFIMELNKFSESNYRYLHLSFHGDMDGIEINGQEITNTRLAGLLKPIIKGKRLFMSSCRGSNMNLASKLIVKCRAVSLIGTPIDLKFDKAALFWPAFYHVVNDLDSNKMNQKSIRSTLKKCVDLFRIPINYYHNLREYPTNHVRRVKFRPNKWTDNRIIKVIRRKN